MNTVPGHVHRRHAAAAAANTATAAWCSDPTPLLTLPMRTTLASFSYPTVRPLPVSHIPQYDPCLSLTSHSLRGKRLIGGVHTLRSREQCSSTQCSSRPSTQLQRCTPTVPLASVHVAATHSEARHTRGDTTLTPWLNRGSLPPQVHVLASLSLLYVVILRCS